MFAHGLVVGYEDGRESVFAEYNASHNESLSDLACLVHERDDLIAEKDARIAQLEAQLAARPVQGVVVSEEARSKRGHQKPSVLTVGEVRKISAHIDTLHARLDAVTRERDALREAMQEIRSLYEYEFEMHNYYSVDEVDAIIRSMGVQSHNEPFPEPPDA